MQLTCASVEREQLSVDFLAVGVPEGQQLVSLDLWTYGDPSWAKAVEAVALREKFTGKAGQSLVVDSMGLMPARQIALFGLGDLKKMRDPDFRRFAALASRKAQSSKATNMAVWLPTTATVEMVSAIGQGISLGAYRFSKYFTGKRVPSVELVDVRLLISGAIDSQLQESLQLGARVGDCVNYARDLVNEPPNELTPVQMAHVAEDIAKKHSLTCKVYDKKHLTKMGAKLMLAVAQGSSREPRLIHLTYKPAQKTSSRLVVVGKGVTFDSGGLSIKPSAGMGEMKSDMAGAANVLGFMAAVAESKLPIEVHGIAAAVENMPDGGAYRPGDVFGSLDGKTVEIINTDAEGRLVLADALAFATKLKPSVLVCNATLTGACVVALGETCSGFYATSDKLSKRFRKAAKRAGEQFWPMPLLRDLRPQLDSSVADLKHTGERWGGSITAALFLKEFVGDVPFVHCDIAGPAFSKKDYDIYPKGGTGQAVLTFLQLAKSM